MATKTEIERLAVVEEKVDGVKADLSEVKSDVKTLSTTLVSELKAVNAKIDNLDSKFAAKWVQTAVAFVIGIVMSAVIGAILLLVIPQHKADTPSTSTTNNTTTSQPATTGSTSSDGKTPSTNASASAQSTPNNPSDTESSSSGGLLNEVPKIIP